jgi:aspartate kinase
MIVMKFGGTSVGSASQIRKVSEIIDAHLHRNPLIVVSALSGVTNHLVKLTEHIDEPLDLTELKWRHRSVMEELGLPSNLLDDEFKELESLLLGASLLQECSDRIKDRILSFGECASSKMVARYLTATLPKEVIHLFSYDLGLITDSAFGGANPLPESVERIRKKVSSFSEKLIVTTGYIGKDLLGNITTLGRNGSDYSASIFGAALETEEIQIWTDVSGILTADPNLVDNAKPVAEISFEEAAELAYYGAKVIHPATIQPAMKKNIPVRVLNTNEPQSQGTTIHSGRRHEEGSVKSIAHFTGITIINIMSTRMLAHHGFLSKIFDLFAKHKIIVDMISTSEVTVSVTTKDGQNLSPLLSDLQTIADVAIETGLSGISVVGEGVRDDFQVTDRVFSKLRQYQIPVRMISMGASKINLSFIIDSNVSRQTIQLLHKEFFPA